MIILSFFFFMIPKKKSKKKSKKTKFIILLIRYIFKHIWFKNKKKWITHLEILNYYRSSLKLITRSQFQSQFWLNLELNSLKTILMITYQCFFPHFFSPPPHRSMYNMLRLLRPVSRCDPGTRENKVKIDLLFFLSALSPQPKPTLFLAL